MIKQVLNIEDKWKVIIYYNVNYNLFTNIAKDLLNIDVSIKTIDRMYNIMITQRAKAVTISNINLHTSVVLFNHHDSVYDYINSIVHEAEHVKQSMLKAYDVSDEGEAPAYTIGYLVMKMLMFLNKSKAIIRIN